MCTDKKPQRRVAGKAVSISLALVLAALLAALPSWALVIVRRVPLNVQPLSVHAHQGPLLESRRVTTLTSASDLQALAHTDRRAVLQQLVEPEPLSPGLAGFGSLLPPPTTYPKVDVTALFARLQRSQQASRAALEVKVGSAPHDVLRGLSPRLADAAAGMSMAEQRRVLVAMQHEDKVQVSRVRGSANFSDADVTRIADDLCALLVEHALPRSNAPRPAADIAEAFVDVALKAQAQGLRSLAAQERSAFATAAMAADDPLMAVKVSNVRATREDGVVDFRITHQGFSAQVQHQTYSFATDVARHPNTPNVEKMSMLPAALFNFGELTLPPRPRQPVKLLDNLGR